MFQPQLINSTNVSTTTYQLNECFNHNLSTQRMNCQLVTIRIPVIVVTISNVTTAWFGGVHNQIMNLATAYQTAKQQ